MPRDTPDFTVEAVAPERPVLDVIAGEIDQLATAAEAALRTSGLPIFQRGNSIVIPISHDVPAAHGRMTLAAGLKDLSSAGIIDHLAQAACFQRWNIRLKKMTPCDPPGMAASIILSRSGQWTLANVAGVITTPTLRPDGSLLSTAGYDPATRLYLVLDPALNMPMIAVKPSRADAEAALALLKSLLDEFPFAAEVDRAVALDCLITPVLRGMLSVAPMKTISANTPGSGKTFLVDLAAAISTGRPCPVLAAAENEDETEKRLVGALLAAYPIISIDNCNGELGGDLLCQAIEHPLVRVRKLGGSDIMEMESRATFYATGNGLRVRGDMTRRTIICNLDAQVERPELRTFQHDPLKHVLENRGKYVAACLTIVRAYLCAGQPDRIKPALASFPDWSNSVRSALVWLGCEDPVKTMDQAREDDPELSALRTVVGAWHAWFVLGPATVAGAISAAGTDDALRESLNAIAGERGGINNRRLGHWIRKNAGRIVQIKKGERDVHSFRFKRDGEVNGSAIWKLEALDEHTASQGF